MPATTCEYANERSNALPRSSGRQQRALGSDPQHLRAGFTSYRVGLSVDAIQMRPSPSSGDDARRDRYRKIGCKVQRSRKPSPGRHRPVDESFGLALHLFLQRSGAGRRQWDRITTRRIGCGGRPRRSQACCRQQRFTLAVIMTPNDDGNASNPEGFINGS